MKKAFAVFALVFSIQSLSYAFKCDPEALKAAYDHYLYQNGQDSLIALNITSTQTQDNSIHYRIAILDLDNQTQSDSWVTVETPSCKVLSVILH